MPSYWPSLASPGPATEGPGLPVVRFLRSAHVGRLGVIAAATAAVAIFAACSSSTSGRSAPEPARTAARSGAATPTVPPATPTVPPTTAAPIPYRAIVAAARSPRRTAAMCGRLFTDPRSAQQLFEVAHPLAAVTAGPPETGVLSCAYPSSAGTDAVVALRVGPKAKVYDQDANVALYSNDTAIAAQWEGENRSAGASAIQDYLQAVLDRISST